MLWSASDRTSWITTYGLLFGRVKGRYTHCTLLSISLLILALHGGAQCTIAVRGAGNSGTFSATPAITASASCTNASAIGLLWGDATATAQDQSSLTANHVYANSGPWYVTVNSAAELFVSFPTTPGTSPTSFFQGQPKPVQAQIATSVPVTKANLQCNNVVDPSGNLVTAGSVHITCDWSSTDASLPIVAAPNCESLILQRCGLPPTAVTNTNSKSVTIQTAGLASSSVFSLLRGSPPDSSWPGIVSAALLLPLVTLRKLRRVARRVLASVAGLLLSLGLVSCGGGFSIPVVATVATPPGVYQVNVDITSETSGFVQTTLIVPLTVAPTQ